MIDWPDQDLTYNSRLLKLGFSLHMVKDDQVPRYDRPDQDLT